MDSPRRLDAHLPIVTAMVDVPVTVTPVAVPQLLPQPVRVPAVGRIDAPFKPGFVPPSKFAAALPLVPMVDKPLPDPGAVKEDGVYTMVGTSNESRDTFPIYQATHRDGPWERVKDAMGKPVSVFSAAERPDWIHPKDADRWAPELHKVGKHWVCMYTARHRDGDLRLGAAVAKSITGPYEDLGPILAAEHGVIDATIARDRESGQYVSIYKLDDNSVGKETPILAQAFELKAGKWTWKGEPHEICRSGEGHGGLLEGPWVVRENGTNWITLSSDYYGGERYKTWIGHIDYLLGDKVHDLKPLLTTDSACLRGAWKGPGHNSLVQEAPGIYSMYFHAWPAGDEVPTDGSAAATEKRDMLWNERFVAGEGRKVLRVTLAFVDERGKPCAPYIVEDRIKA